MTNNFVVTDDSWNCLWKKLQDFEIFLLVQNKNLRWGGGQKYFLKNARIKSKLLPFDAESQGEQLYGHCRLMKTSLKKVTRLWKIFISAK